MGYGRLTSHTVDGSEIPRPTTVWMVIKHCEIMEFQLPTSTGFLAGFPSIVWPPFTKEIALDPPIISGASYKSQGHRVLNISGTSWSSCGFFPSMQQKASPCHCCPTPWSSNAALMGRKRRPSGEKWQEGTAPWKKRVTLGNYGYFNDIIMILLWYSMMVYIYIRYMM